MSFAEFYASEINGLNGALTAANLLRNARTSLYAAKFSARVQQLKVGDPADKTTEV